MIYWLDKLQELIKELDNASPEARAALTTLGLLISLYVALRLIFYLLHLFRLYTLDQVLACGRVDLRDKYGDWALVTGATDGIGLEFARRLADQGMSLIIVGRNEEKLAQVKSNLESIKNVGKVVALKKDFSEPSLDSYEQLRAQIEAQTKHVGVLINNVGIYPTSAERFDKINCRSLSEMLQINTLSMTIVTRYIMAQMVERNRGLVVNVSSVAGAVNMPYVSIYGPTKAFVNSFSKQLQLEYSNYDGIKVVNLNTGPVSTSTVTNIMEERDSTRWTLRAVFVSTEAYLNCVMNILRKSSPPAECAGHLLHELQILGLNIGSSLNLYNVSSKSLFSKVRDVNLTPVPKRKSDDKHAGALA